MKKLFVVVLLIGLGLSAGYAQETESGINENSVRPIHEQNQMYKKRVWRRMDLNEKQNKPFFAYNKEISRFIINMVEKGLLIPYENDSLQSRMTKEEFFENLEMPDYGGGGDDDFGDFGGGGGGGGWGDTGGGGGWGDTGGTEEEEEAEPEEPAADYFLPSNITILEIMEDVIFDRKRSRMYYDMLSVKMIIPAEQFETGIFRPVAVFKFKDLHQLFKEFPEDAIWFNPLNSAQHRNFADAFDLRLFEARIIKIANPDNETINDVYNTDSPKGGIFASQNLEYEMMEYESSLWEY